MTDRKRTRGNDDDDVGRAMEGNDMRVDRQPRIRAARRDNIQHTPFMRDITSMRQQLVERQNEQFSHQLTKINGGSTRDEEKGNLIAQLAAENVRVYRSIDAHYPDRELGADVVGMGNDDTMSLGIRQDEDELVKSEYPPTIARNIPQRVMVDIAAGGTHSATLHTDGTVYTFGSNDDGQLGRYDIQEGLEFKAGKVVKDKSEKPLERITEIHAGDSHTLMKDDKGNVFFVGMYKDTDSGKWRPMPEGSNESIKGSHKHAYHIELPRPAKYIASGFNFSAAVLPAADDHNGLADELYTWGMGHCGALGRSKSMGCPDKEQSISVEVKNPDGSIGAQTIQFTAPDTGKTFMGGDVTRMVVKTRKRPDGTVEQYTEEDTYYEYQLDKVNKFLKPAPVEWSGPKVARQVLSVAIGEVHMLVVARESMNGEFAFQPRVYSCGHGGKGQLGHPDFIEKHELTPIKALDGKMISKVAAGIGHNLALDMFGQNVYSWGDSKYGTLGLFDVDVLEFANTPRAIAFPEELGDTCIVDIEVGDTVSFAITQDGDVYSWGNGLMGANGQPEDADTRRPKLVNVMRKIEKNAECRILRVSGGGQHSLMLIKRYRK